MISHEDVWTAIDTLAARHGLTASGLARKAGLDPTAFNRSKRVAGGGRQRWPTTESLAKVMAATGTTIRDLVGLLGIASRKGCDDPLEDGPAPGFFESQGARAALRAALASNAETLVFRVPSGGLPPLYRSGDRLVVDLADVIKPGYRALVITTEGEVHAGSVRLSGEHEDLAIAGARGKVGFRKDDIAFSARIIWASQ